jgi:hypothetical protein
VPEHCRWRAWYAHITLSMLALAGLAAAGAQAAKGGPQPATSLIGLTVPEIRRILVRLILRHAHPPSTSGPGRTGADDASTKPKSATTAAAATRHNCR